MLALVLEDEVRLVDDAEVPKRRAGEALVRVRVAGVCDTDLQLARGYMGYRGILGREFVGEVLESDTAAWRGKRVVADINAGCGVCVECRDRGGHHCPNRTVLGILGRGGALAERLTIPEACLVAVPDGVDDDDAVFAEPLAAALHVLDVVGPRREAVVLGDGKLGLLLAMSLAQADIATTLVGHHPEKLGLAAGCAGLLEADVSDEVRAPIVVEATGTARGLERALAMCAPRGTVVLKSTIAGGHDVDLSPVVINELSVVGSRCGDMALAIDCLAAKRVDPRPLIAARYPLAEADEALRHAGRRGALKILVDAK